MAFLGGFRNHHKYTKAEDGPFTWGFWIRKSIWLIIGGSFIELNRPTDTISLSQHSALALRGFCFTGYTLSVAQLGGVFLPANIAFFLISTWHVGRKIVADFLFLNDDDDHHHPQGEMIIEPFVTTTTSFH